MDAGGRSSARGHGRPRPAFHAAVRLARWLAADSAARGTTLAALLSRHGDEDAWVDSAINDAAPGVSDPDLGAGLAAVLAAVRARRAAHDRAFAHALAQYTAETRGDPGGRGGVWRLEDLLPRSSCRWPARRPFCCSSWTG